MDISTHHGKVLEKELTNELTNELKNEVNVNDITMDNEGIHVNVTLRSKLYNLVKENLLYFHTKLTKLMSCTTKTVEKIYEPVAIEKIEVKVEEPIFTKEPVTSEEKLESIKEPFEEHLEIEPPIQIESPISVEERS
jgi:hypothetical protein